MVRRRRRMNEGPDIIPRRRATNTRGPRTEIAIPKLPFLNSVSEVFRFNVKRVGNLHVNVKGWTLRLHGVLKNHYIAQFELDRSVNVW